MDTKNENDRLEHYTKNLEREDLSDYKIIFDQELNTSYATDNSGKLLSIEGNYDDRI